YLVTNHGLTPRNLTLALDPALSKLTDAQLKWFRVDPPRVTLAPGTNATVTLHVDAPAARGAFSQLLRANLVAVDPSAPFAVATGALALDFEPQGREDIALEVRVDDKPVGGDRLSIEEGIPHSISVVATN